MIRGLRSIGPAAAPAVDHLIGIVESMNSSGSVGLRELYAVQALGNIGEPALKSIPTLERATQVKEGLVADRVAEEAHKSLDKLRRIAEEKREANDEIQEKSREAKRKSK